jgi:hypothetical protein
MKRKSVIPKISKEVLKERKKRKDPDLPEFQPTLRKEHVSLKK